MNNITIEIKTNPEIEKIASEIIGRYNDLCDISTHIVKVANSLGIEVIEAIFERKDISGMLVCDENVVPKMYINHEEPGVRKRFTIAHEISHYILHKELMLANRQNIMYRDKYNCIGNNKDLEIQANKLAACLLMPEQKAREIWNSIKDIDVFAKLFLVSRESAIIRLAGLRLI